MIDKKVFVIIPIFLGLVGVFFIANKGVRNGQNHQPLTEDVPLTSPSLEAGQIDEIILTDLEIPWEIAFLPDGRMLVTERPGSLVLVDESKEIIEVDSVSHIGEGGLLGLAVHPDFSQNNWIYLYFTSEENGEIVNQVERFQLTDNNLTDQTVIIDNMPGGFTHNGGRIKFGPDGYLYISTGDAGNPNLSQDENSLAGKILRLNDDGSIPDDNPFENAVWSLGHRNPQGFTWDDQERLWATEHGSSAEDELNLIQPGENYGWPIIRGDEEREDMVSPVIHSGTDTTWAPAGAVYFQGSIYFGGLRGSRLYQYQIEEDQLVEHLVDKYGRLRAVSLQNEFLYLSTSNTDGRGNPVPEDDRVIKVDLNSL